MSEVRIEGSLVRVSGMRRGLSYDEAKSLVRNLEEALQNPRLIEETRRLAAEEIERGEKYLNRIRERLLEMELAG